MDRCIERSLLTRHYSLLTDIQFLVGGIVRMERIYNRLLKVRARIHPMISLILEKLRSLANTFFRLAESFTLSGRVGKIF